MSECSSGRSSRGLLCDVHGVACKILVLLNYHIRNTLLLVEVLIGSSQINCNVLTNVILVCCLATYDFENFVGSV